MDLTDDEKKKISKDVNNAMQEAFSRFEEICKQVGATEKEIEDLRFYVDEPFWLRVHNFGY